MDVMLPSDRWLRFVEQHGVVLESGRGSRLSLAEAVAARAFTAAGGSTRRPGRFSRPRGACVIPSDSRVPFDKRKVTYVHRRLWPASVCLAGGLDKRVSARCGRNIRAREPTEFAQFGFHGGCRLKFCGQRGTPRKIRLTFNWVTGSNHIFARAL